MGWYLLYSNKLSQNSLIKALNLAETGATIKLLPLQVFPKFIVIVIAFRGLRLHIKLGKIKVSHQVIFHMIHSILKGFNELRKIFFV